MQIKKWKALFYTKKLCERNWEDNMYIFKSFSLPIPGPRSSTAALAYDPETCLLAIAYDERGIYVYKYYDHGLAQPLFQFRLQYPGEGTPQFSGFCSSNSFGLKFIQHTSQLVLHCNVHHMAGATEEARVLYSWNREKLLWNYSWPRSDFSPLCINSQYIFVVDGASQVQGYNFLGVLSKTFYSISKLTDITSDDSFIIGVSDDGLAEIWDISTESLIRSLDLNFTSFSLPGIKLGLHSNFLIAAGQHSVIKTFDLNTGLLITCTKGVEYQSDLQVNSRGFMVVSSKVGHCPFFFDARRGFYTLVLGLPHSISSFFLSDIMMICSHSNKLDVWNWDQSRKIVKLCDDEHQGIYGPSFAHRANSIVWCFSWTSGISLAVGSGNSSWGLHRDYINYCLGSRAAKTLQTLVPAELGVPLTVHVKSFYPPQEQELTIIPEPCDAGGLLGFRATPCETNPLQSILRWRQGAQPPSQSDSVATNKGIPGVRIFTLEEPLTDSTFL
ncbi:hypothetical protein Pelo_13059 [Pelomyxa schiedti]|nr:hypothetical protein Pelo_13059 [Pelomyxa schiedti]